MYANNKPTTGRIKRARRRAGQAALAFMLALAAAGPAALAQQAEEAPVLYRSDGGQFEVPVNKSGVIRVGQPVRRVSVGNPGIVDVLVLRTQEVYVVGKAIGSTNITLWDSRDSVFATLNINVTPDLESLKRKLHELFPDDSIGVQSAQERIVLSGQVSSLVKMDAAKQLATGFLSECVDPVSNAAVRDNTAGAPVILQQGAHGKASGDACKKGSVINLIEIGGAQQVLLEVKVAEVSRTLLNRLDGSINLFKFGRQGNVGGSSNGVLFPPSGISGSGGAPVNNPGDVLTNLDSINLTGIFGNLLTSNSFFLQVILDISRRNDLAKILAEPTLTTLSGQEAQFLSGGEFPIPIPQGGDSSSVTIEFKDFGVGVKFLPVVLNSGQINLKLNVSVSDITQANSVAVQLPNASSTFVIPSLIKRSASSTVELADGQTIGIAGLISDNVREFVDKIPLLGDIPVLGALFRSQEFRHDETELVIFVTPHLARPIAPGAVRLPTDKFVPPNALEFYLLGRTESGRQPATAVNTANPDGGAAGSSFGHEP